MRYRPNLSKINISLLRPGRERYMGNSPRLRSAGVISPVPPASSIFQGRPQLPERTSWNQGRPFPLAPAALLGQQARYSKADLDVFASSIQASPIAGPQFQQSGRAQWLRQRFAARQLGLAISGHRVASAARAPYNSQIAFQCGRAALPKAAPPLPALWLLPARSALLLPPRTWRCPHACQADLRARLVSSLTPPLHKLSTA